MQNSSELRDWLDSRFSRGGDGYYFAHQPVYGLGSAHSEPGHLRRLARTLNLLLALSRLEFRSFLDVGAGEGYLSVLINRLLSAEGVALELSLEAARRARELFGIRSVVADAHELPFPDGSFDLVLASELIEHVERPWQVAAELRRVARRYVVVSTEEFCLDEQEQQLKLRLRDFHIPHPERNFFTAGDLRRLLGDDIALQPQFRSYLPRDEGRMSPDAARRLISRIAQVDEITPLTRGIIALAHQKEARVADSPRLDREETLDFLLKPLVASPTTIPSIEPLPWPAVPQPVCQVANCSAQGKPGRQCPHLIRHAEGIQEYRAPERASIKAPTWALKFAPENIATGTQRQELSRIMRGRDLREIAGAPEPFGVKLAWLAGRLWRRLGQLFASKHSHT